MSLQIEIAFLTLTSDYSSLKRRDRDGLPVRLSAWSGVGHTAWMDDLHGRRRCDRIANLPVGNSLDWHWLGRGQRSLWSLRVATRHRPLILHRRMV